MPTSYLTLNQRHNSWQSEIQVMKSLVEALFTVHDTLQCKRSENLEKMKLPWINREEGYKQIETSWQQAKQVKLHFIHFRL